MSSFTIPIQYSRIWHQTLNFSVRSFTQDEVRYTVNVKNICDGDRNIPVLTECSCPDFVQNQTKCKHLFLVSRFSLHPIHLHGRFSPQLSLPSTSPPNAIDQDAINAAKCALEVQILDTLRKIGSINEALPLRALSRDSLVSINERLTNLYRDIQDKVHNRPLYATQS